MPYKKIWISESEYRVQELLPDNRTRFVSERQPDYLLWLESGKTPEEVPYTPPAPPPLPTLEEAKAAKLLEISEAYARYDAAGTVMTSAGFPIQSGQEHCTKLDGAIRFAEMTEQTEIYITDADNVTHYGISLPAAKLVLIEQMTAALGAHAMKQQLRAAAEAAVTVEEVAAISWENTPDNYTEED